jgi:GH24 family phage-related lysozyme (muramidase)
MMYAKKASATGLEYIRRFEKFVPTPYRDSAGKWTIGYGHLILPHETFTRITLEEGEALFKEDVRKAEDAIHRFVKVPLTQPQFDALTSWVFNLGSGNLSTSTLLKKLNAGDYVGAGDEFTRWVYAGGEIQPGLVSRRKEEQKTWRSA